MANFLQIPGHWQTAMSRLMQCCMPNVWFIICILLSTLVQGQTETVLDDAEIQSFMNAIIGDWDGRAIETPIGPRTYNIRFTKNQHGHVKGQRGVNTIHYWDFSQAPGVIKLRFLTTFAGNTQPIFFESRQRNEQGYIFHSINRDDVKLIIKPANAAVTIRIILRNNPHVTIQLIEQGV